MVQGKTPGDVQIAVRSLKARFADLARAPLNLYPAFNPRRDAPSPSPAASWPTVLLPSEDFLPSLKQNRIAGLGPAVPAARKLQPAGSSASAHRHFPVAGA